MKRLVLAVALTLALLIGLSACDLVVDSVRGSGTVIEESRTVEAISAVQLATEGTLHIEMGDRPALVIEAEDNLFDYIETNVRAGKLVIETRPQVNLQNRRPIDYYLTVEDLDAIQVSSSGNVEAGALQTESFEVAISSSGNVTISDLDCSSLRVEISSSGNLDIRGGRTQRQTVNISSSGEYEAKNLASDAAEVTLTSSGTATIQVSDRLRGRLSSSGNLRYQGSPVVDVRTTSSGRVVQIGD